MIDLQIDQSQHWTVIISLHVRCVHLSVRVTPAHYLRPRSVVHMLNMPVFNKGRFSNHMQWIPRFAVHAICPLLLIHIVFVNLSYLIRDLPEA